jgi:hypothetical protein
MEKHNIKSKINQEITGGKTHVNGEKYTNKRTNKDVM